MQKIEDFKINPAPNTTVDGQNPQTPEHHLVSMKPAPQISMLQVQHMFLVGERTLLGTNGLATRNKGPRF